VVPSELAELVLELELLELDDVAASVFAPAALVRALLADGTSALNVAGIR
jgi:hypothetical protein